CYNERTDRYMHQGATQEEAHEVFVRNLREDIVYARVEEMEDEDNTNTQVEVIAILETLRFGNGRKI
ncbi:hypothetical protein HAX54_007332, partial [Datura stramonium]|nr:hypothetical protein [Datura stramonium]